MINIKRTCDKNQKIHRNSLFKKVFIYHNLDRLDISQNPFFTFCFVLVLIGFDQFFFLYFAFELNILMLSLVIHMKVSIIAEKIYKQLIYSPYEKHQIKHFTVYIYTILSLKYSINYEKSEQKRVNNHYCLSVRDSSYVKVTIIAPVTPITWMYQVIPCKSIEFVLSMFHVSVN